MATHADRRGDRTAPAEVRRPTDEAGGTPRAPRRRVRLLPIAVVIVVALGIAGSVGPFLDYRAVERERKAMEAEVALLEQENLATEEQIDQLGRDAYLESLARKELNLARPGEDVYIVTVPETTTTESPSLDEGSGPGPLERALNSLLDLF